MSFPGAQGLCFCTGSNLCLPGTARSLQKRGRGVRKGTPCFRVRTSQQGLYKDTFCSRGQRGTAQHHGGTHLPQQAPAQRGKPWRIHLSKQIEHDSLIKTSISDPKRLPLVLFVFHIIASWNAYVQLRTSSILHLQQMVKTPRHGQVMHLVLQTRSPVPGRASGVLVHLWGALVET